MKNRALGVITKTIKRNFILFSLIIISIAIAIITALLPPLVLEKIVNDLVAAKSISMKLAILYFSLIAVSLLSVALRETLLAVFAQRVTKELRIALDDKLTKLSTGELTKAEEGSIASRFIGDADTVEALFTNGVISMASDALSLISIIYIIARKSLGLMLLLLLLIPLLFLYTRMMQKKMLKSQIENREAISEASAEVPEAINNIRMIKNYFKEEYFEKRYEESLKKSFKALEKSNFYDSIYSPMILMINAIVIAAMMLSTASNNPALNTLFAMSAGTAAAMISYINKIFTPIQSIGMEIQTIQSALAGFYRINEFLSLEEQEGIDQSITKEQLILDKAIEIDNLTFGYDKQKSIIKEYSLSCGKGEEIMIKGRTGSGKSTLFKLILGLYRPDSGSVKVFSQDAYKIPSNLKRNIFGYVEQEFHPIKGTILEEITLGDKNITEEMAIEAAKKAGIHKTIMSLPNAYATLFEKQLFSEGEYQLISIARAIASDPEILLLDEITAALDSSTEEKVLNALISASKGRTVLSISHRMAERKQMRIVEII